MLIFFCASFFSASPSALAISWLYCSSLLSIYFRCLSIFLVLKLFFLLFCARSLVPSPAMSLPPIRLKFLASCCLLYTSDAADEEDSVDLGGRRIIKKKIIQVKC